MITRRQKMEDFAQSVSEELELSYGIISKVINSTIKVDTIGGMIEYNCRYLPNIMADVNTIVMYIGGKMRTLGLDERLKALENKV